MTVENDAVPSWLPQSVVRLSKAAPLRNEIRQRLLNDERMKDVWGFLKRAEVIDAEQRLRTFRPAYDLRSWGINDDDVTINDQLCGAFFLFLLHSFSYNQFTSTRSVMDKHAARWVEAAAVCEESYNNSMLGPIDDQLRQALPKIAEHFKMIGSLIKNEGNPRILKISGKGDTVRSHVRAGAQVTEALFGSYLYGILAKVTATALGIETLDKGAVEKMCKDLAPYKGWG